jgi:hypothetical protein
MCLGRDVMMAGILGSYELQVEGGDCISTVTTGFASTLQYYPFQSFHLP